MTPSGPGGSGDRLAEVLPADLLPLFDARFTGSCDLFEEYVLRLAIRVVRDLALDAAARSPGTAEEIAARAGLDPERTGSTVGWLLATLAMRGLSAGEVDGRFQIAAALPDLDPREVAAEQERHDPTSLPSYRMADLVGALYPRVLRGETSGEETLFAPDRIGAWIEYFSNDNLIYAVSNRIGALVAARSLAAGGRALEIGGGLGSSAETLLGTLSEEGRLEGVREYRFTEVAPAFLRRGQRLLAGRFPGTALAYGRLDIDRPFEEAGVGAGAFSLVYGVNTLHVAHDLEFTLGEVRRALAPGGSLVLSECVRPFPGRPVYIEFLFNLLRAFRAPRLVTPWRPNGGFLTPEQWTAGLLACGFRDVTVYPDIARVREVCPAFVVAAIAARRA